ncbi:hypothetical protein T459_28863 [Capsicum annuum]|uniref:ubiquitinyl hydrolase 1 n=1 Tax=Capsicum annuum TaxID=4072 RepID=A0A2G2YI16_CAPAN|nr:hypothetical protein T459_28863 [Capsicum annuum]
MCFEHGKKYYSIAENHMPQEINTQTLDTLGSFSVQGLCSSSMAEPADRDDPSQPLVTAPFGHASQEIVNLLLSGEAVANGFGWWHVCEGESHNSFLLALDTKVQEENELEGKETKIRRAFDARDQSGGGGFISVEGFHQVLRETNVYLPADKLQNLCMEAVDTLYGVNSGRVLLDLDKSFFFFWEGRKILVD